MSRTSHLVEKAVSKTVFDRILASGGYRMGFECEVCLVPTSIYKADGSPFPNIDLLTWAKLKPMLRISSFQWGNIRAAFEDFISDRARSAWNMHKKEIADDPEALAERPQWLAAKREALARSTSMDQFIALSFGSNRNFLEYFSIGPSADYPDLLLDAETMRDKVYAAAAQSLNDAVAAPVKPLTAYHAETKRADTWYIEPDSSLRAEEPGQVAAEIVSGVYDLRDGLAALAGAFEWIGINAQTNVSTGLHVSLSMPGKKMADFDFLKMMILSDENYVAGLFERLGNRYCADMRSLLRSMLGMDVSPLISVEAAFESRDLTKVTTVLRRVGAVLMQKWEKHASMAARPGDGDAIFEFRSMGGPHYERRFPEIRRRVVNMANILRIGCDPASHAEEYVRKVFQALELHKFAVAQPSGPRSNGQRLAQKEAGMRDLINAVSATMKIPTERVIEWQETAPKQFVAAVSLAFQTSRVLPDPRALSALRRYIASRQVPKDIVADEPDASSLAHALWPSSRP